MDPFHAETPCPRCGQPGAGFRRHDRDCPQFGAVGEHMHRTCGACGHEWPEEARDLRIPDTSRAEPPVEVPSRWRSFVWRFTGQWAPSSGARKAARS